MDNLTHSVVGLGVGELIQRSLAPEADAARHGTRHRLLLIACAAASNFPDLDLVLTRLAPAPLGYLLHHRGHTHTLLGLLPQALLLLAALACWPAARRLLRASAAARHGLALALAAGLLLHLGMDYLNNYGVHPFHPWRSDWYYGDLVFIVEPVFWVAFGVPLIMTMRARGARAMLLAVLAVVLLYVTMHGYLAWASLAGLLLLGAAVAALRLAHWESRKALLLALAVCCGFVAVQAGAARQARQAVTAALAHSDPALRVLDVALTAYPAQPLCWQFTSIASDGQIYQLRRGQLSLAPGWLAPQACAPALGSAAGRPGAVPGLLFKSAWQGSVAALRAQAGADCGLQAWLRFARMPAIQDGVASDLRFASTPRGNFTSLALATDRRCPWPLPRWGRPRADLLEPRR